MCDCKIKTYWLFHSSIECAFYEGSRKGFVWNIAFKYIEILEMRL